MKKLILCLAVLAPLAGCREEDPDGPNLNDLYGEFSVVTDIQPSHQSIDFPSDCDLVFNGELSKNTDWQIQLTGANSGAPRTLTGFDRIISAENAAWNGGATTFPSFGLEDVYVEISFPNEADAAVLYDTITVTATNIDVGTLITGFEDGNGSNWAFFNQATVDGRIACGTEESATGNCHYGFNGTVGWDWAIGSVTIRPDNGGPFGLGANASNLYFNMGFKALENIGESSSFVLLWFDEDDNGDGVYQEATEDRFTFEYWSKYSTWNLITKNYNDLQFDSEGAAVVTNGNGLPEPDKLVSINVFFLANPDNGNARAIVDQLIFTENEPYTP